MERKGTEGATDLLAAWRASDARAKAVTREWGIVALEQAATRTALELFRAMIAGEVPAPPIGRTLDFIMVEADAGRIVFQGWPGFAHYNPMGSVHGGWFAALLDSALGCAVASVLPLGKVYTTAEFHMNIVRPLTDKVELVRAEGKIVHQGGRMATADGRLTGPDGKLYAHATTTCFVFDAQ